MGLDMYLYKKTYVKNWNHTSPEAINYITIKQGGEERKDIKPERISYIIEEVGYWRKFNALHGWFVESCGNGEDSCQEIYVGEDKMKELLETLKNVQTILNESKLVTKVVKDWNGKDYEVQVYDKEDEIKETFSPTEGFFFGSTDVDTYFHKDVVSTIELIESLLKENESIDPVRGFYSGDFYYQASW
jgi:hypothetical protein